MKPINPPRNSPASMASRSTEELPTRESNSADVAEGPEYTFL